MVLRKPNHRILPPTDEELEKVRDVIHSQNNYLNNPAGDFLRVRDETIIFFNVLTGLRPGETMNLKWSDIDWEQNRIYINPWNNKERESEYAFLTLKAKNLLMEYKRLFDKFLKLEWVFPSLISFDAIQEHSFSRRYRQLFEKAGIKRILYFTEAGKPITNAQFYGTRKKFGTNLYLRTKDSHLLKRALRHRFMSSQESYVLPDERQVAYTIDAAQSDVF